MIDTYIIKTKTNGNSYFHQTKEEEEVTHN